MIAMDHLTHRTLHRQESMNCVSNRFPHPPYSPDPAPCDYYLFLNLKKWLCGRRFESNEEVEWEIEEYFGGFDKSYYLEDILGVQISFEGLTKDGETSIQSHWSIL